MNRGTRFAALMALLTALPAQAQAYQSREPLLRVTDPTGDAHGDGSAELPTQPALLPEALDLRSFEVWPRGRVLTFRTEFGTLQNPWNAPGGFSAQTLDIFIGTRSGGESTLADLNLRTEGGGWQYHLRVTGQGAHWAHASEPAGPETPGTGAAGPGVQPESAAPALPPPPQVRTEGGNTLVIDTELPRGRYAYWVTSSVYSPMSAGGVLQPGGSGPFSVRVPAGRAPVPVPLDVLAEEASPQPFNLGQLAPVGRLNDFRPWLLWGLGLLGLTLAAGASISLWRTPREEVLLLPRR
ncbi:hypothetical protein GCM10017783_14350 [Deinococcus piscis]|uniref:Glucodextranase-like C-terminal domain-containing protein n=1 Tax=Deinococcus piscis TaxID=394230 RepID=A0ABQ3K8Y2_9DEIO|nr:glucodextranase DOMON-like domain-containing protein [Deinococcus piscis]GHG03150.1 hypothetical protein GCM10017783_14350 [Deinococcus piscis]